MKIWVHLTFVLVHLFLGAPVQPVQKVSLEPCDSCSITENQVVILTESDTDSGFSCLLQ